MFITKRHMPRRTFLRGMGATIALPLLDAMVPAMAADACGAKPLQLPARAAWRGAGLLAADRLRQELGAVAHPSADRAVQGPHHGHQRHRSPHGHVALSRGKRRRPFAHGGRVLERRASEAHRRPGHRRRHHDRPGAREQDRPTEPPALARDVHRGRRLARRLRRRLQLRLYELDRLVVADLTAADGAQPASRVRAAVRRRRHGRGARGAQARRSQHLGLGARRHGPAEARAWARATSPASTTTSTTSARSSAASRWPSRPRPSTPSGRRRRRCRSTST